MIIATAPATGPLVISTYPRAAGEPFAADPIGNSCVDGLPCEPSETKITIEPGFPHVILPGRPERLAARCWRKLLYACAWHDGTAYTLPQPVILGPRKAPPGNPTMKPYRTCCWDYGGNPIVLHNKAGEPIYYGRADLAGQPGQPQLTGARLFELIVTAYDQCCAAKRAAFLSQVPAGMYHDLRVSVVVWVLNRGRLPPPGAGAPEYVDTEVLDITINRYDATPRSA